MEDRRLERAIVSLKESVEMLGEVSEQEERRMGSIQNALKRWLKSSENPIADATNAIAWVADFLEELAEKKPYRDEKEKAEMMKKAVKMIYDSLKGVDPIWQEWRRKGFEPGW